MRGQPAAEPGASQHPHTAAAASWLPTLTELHLAYSCKTFPSPPNLAAEAAAWPGLPLRQLSLHGLSVPVAVLQRLAELPGGVRSLELNFCEIESTPRQVAKVLKGMYKLRELKMRRLFHAPASCSLMAGTRELMRTLGCIHLHTLEVDDMPLGNFVQELAAETDRWLERQLPLQRLVLSNCNLNNRATYAVLKACRNLRELSLRHNLPGGMGDRAFGDGNDEWTWRRHVQLPKLQWLDVRCTRVTHAGVAKLFSY